MCKIIDCASEGLYLDEKNRLVKDILENGKVARYYCGSDAEGIILKDDGGEYINVGKEKRYWKGIIDSLPSKELLTNIKDFSLFILKPDVERRGLSGMILSMLDKKGFSVVAEKSILLGQDIIFRLYPYFFTKCWEDNLLRYFCSGTSKCMIVTGNSVERDLFYLRNEIRREYKEKNEHQVTNLVHCADSAYDSLREALLFFKPEEIIEKVGSFSG